MRPPRTGWSQVLRGLPAALLLLALTGCDPQGGEGGVSVALTFEDNDVASTVATSRDGVSPSTRGSGSEGAASSSVDSSMEPLTQFYASIGDRVGSYTPTKFRMFIVEIGLYNPAPDGEGVELDAPLAADSATNSDKHYADFVEEVIIRGGEPVPPGSYNRMWFMFSAYRGEMTSNTFDGALPMVPEIEVEIPGYGQVDRDGDGGADGPVWRNLPSRDGKGMSREYLGNDTFLFVPRRLQPGTYNWKYDDGGDEKTIDPIEHFAYFADANSYRGIFPDIDGVPDSWSTAEPESLGTPHMNAEGFGSAIVVPSGPVEVPADATEVLVRVEWDLDGIIEVYDRETPDDKTDDVVVFANNFWERLNLTVEAQ